MLVIIYIPMITISMATDNTASSVAGQGAKGDHYLTNEEFKKKFSSPYMDACIAHTLCVPHSPLYVQRNHVGLSPQSSSCIFVCPPYSLHTYLSPFIQYILNFCFYFRKIEYLHCDHDLN